MIKQHTVSYAQNREDLILAGFFDDNEKGFYVDVGANEPTHESVTKYFYDKGWSGINIEPIPVLFEKLKDFRKRDINLQLGIGVKESTATLHYYPHGDGLSTLSDEMANEYKKHTSDFTKDAEEISIKVVPLKTVLTEHVGNKTIAFMKIDVEGMEHDVLLSNDWKKFRPEVICIEANHIQSDWQKLLRDEGYTSVFFDGLNEYYTDNTTDRAKKFDYVKAIIFKEPIVNFRLLDDFEEYEKTVTWLDETKTQLTAEAESSNKRILELEKEIHEITPLARHIKRQIWRNLQLIDHKIIKSLEGNQRHNPIPVTEEGELLHAAKENDRINYAAYNEGVGRPFLFKIYLKIRSTAVKIIRKILSARKKRISKA